MPRALRTFQLAWEHTKIEKPAQNGHLYETDSFLCSKGVRFIEVWLHLKVEIPGGVEEYSLLNLQFLYKSKTLQVNPVKHELKRNLHGQTLQIQCLCSHVNESPNSLKTNAQQISLNDTWFDHGINIWIKSNQIITNNRI